MKRVKDGQSSYHDGRRRRKRNRYGIRSSELTAIDSKGIHVAHMGKQLPHSPFDRRGNGRQDIFKFRVEFSVCRMPCRFAL